MLIQSAIASELSGRICGLAALRTNSGTALRRTPNRIVSQTFRAVRSRGFYAELCGVWRCLSSSQRAGWDLYATRVWRPGRFRSPIKLTGFSHFIRSNLPRRLFLPRNFTRTTAPKAFNIGATPLITDFQAYTHPGNYITLYWTNFIADIEAAPSGLSRILVYISPPASRTASTTSMIPRRATFKSVAGSASQPQSLSTPDYVYHWRDSGYQRVCLGVRTTYSDGRLSAMARAYTFTT